MRATDANAPLRAKDLIPVELTREKGDTIHRPEAKYERAGEKRKAAAVAGTEARFVCQVSHKPITYQKAVLLKTTGVIMLEGVAKELAYPTMTCPITSEPFRAKDILELAQMRTGYCASNKDDVSKAYATIDRVTIV